MVRSGVAGRSGVHIPGGAGNNESEGNDERDRGRDSCAHRAGAPFRSISRASLPSSANWIGCELTPLLAIRKAVIVGPASPDCLPLFGPELRADDSTEDDPTDAK